MMSAAMICADCHEEIVVLQTGRWDGNRFIDGIITVCGCNRDYGRDYVPEEDQGLGCSRTVLSYERERQEMEDWQRDHGPLQ